MPLCSNVGGVLQNYALQEVLKNLGHNPITLRLATEYQGVSKLGFWFYLYPKLILKFIIKRMLGKPCSFPESYIKWLNRTSGLNQFVHNYIKTTSYSRKITKRTIQKYHVDIVVVGSDQIWRPSALNVMNNYFCSFAEGSDIRRISYAASFAQDEWPFDVTMTKRARELIKEFEAVSVREHDAVSLCNKYLEIDAEWVLDPTMLLSKEHYLGLCDNIPIEQEPFVFAYILDPTSGKLSFIERLASKINCKVKSLGIENENINNTIENWLACIRDAEFVITDSFHGAVFSLIFRKQFYCFNNSNRGKSRMDSMKLLTGLNDRFISPQDNLNFDDIDYLSVGQKIEKMREKSLIFLKKFVD